MALFECKPESRVLTRLQRSAGRGWGMLATTPHGDACTFPEFECMFHNAGFRSVELHEIPSSPRRVVIGSK